MSPNEPPNRPERAARQETSKQLPLIEPIVRSLNDPREPAVEQSEGGVNPPAPFQEPVLFSGQKYSQTTDIQAERQVVQVTIGRVDVRAIFAPPAQEPQQPRSTPAMSLDDYLRQRDGGKP
jgi:hypothetical protein